MDGNSAKTSVSRGLSSNTAILLIVAVSVIALLPLYTILIPPLTDLAQHLYVNKLLWEHLAGVSHLDLEVTPYIGYRLPSVVIVLLISVCKILGIPLVYLPKIFTITLISVHAAAVVLVLNQGLRDGSWRRIILAAAFSLPAVAAMYSAAWFIGFVGFTMGVTLLLPAIYFTEKYLLTAGRWNAFLIFLFLLLAYTAHPFATFFWLFWCLCRLLASLATVSVRAEWKRLFFLGVIFIPIALYHFLATSGGELGFSTQNLVNETPFVALDVWWNTRFLGIVGGDYLKADETADSWIFAITSIVLFVFSLILVFTSRLYPDLRRTVLTGLLFVLLASWVNEKFIPVPIGHWLAYDYRFSTTAYVICLAIAGFAAIRLLPTENDKSWYRAVFYAFASIALVGSLFHLKEVRLAYSRFDAPARDFVEKSFGHERPNGNLLPRNRWTLDTNFMRHYVCLNEPDCNPAGATFQRSGGQLYPVKLLSPKPVFAPGEPILDLSAEPVTAFKGGQGFGRGHFVKPRGLATDVAGNIYVADTAAARIQKFDAKGNFVLTLGKYGDDVGSLKTPAGIAVDSKGNIYVVDSTKGTLVRFSVDGLFSKEWRGPELQFNGPRDVTIGPNDIVYVLDQGSGRVVRFDPSVESFTAWASAGNEEGQLSRPTGIAVGAEFLIVADQGNDRIQIFDLEGKFVRQWKVQAWGGYVWNHPDVAFDGKTNRIYASNGWKKEILVFDLYGNELPSLKTNELYSDENLSALAISATGGPPRLYVLNIGSDYADNLGDPNVTFADF